MSRMLGLDISGAPHVQVRCKPAFRERLFAIMLMGYEAELHSPAGALDGVEAFLSVDQHRCPCRKFDPGGERSRVR